MAEHPAVAFLAAALARAEETAKAASREGAAAWKTADHASDTRAVIDDRGEAVVYNEGWPTEEQAVHIALHDPAAVLRHVAADRQILAEHRPVQAVGYDGYGVAVIDTCFLCGSQYAPYPCRTVLLLAQAWGWAEET